MQALRDAMSQITSKNAVVFGISTDSVESHKGFVEKEKLNFPLLADTEGKMSEAYGVLMPNKMSSRVTFVIGPDGRIQHIDRAVNSQFFRDGSALHTRHGENLALGLTDWRAKIGQRIPPFSLPNYDWKTVSSQPAGKKAVVIAFISKSCAVSNRYDGRLAALAGDPNYKDVAFLGITSNAGETVAQIRAHAEQAKLGFPVATDEDGAIARHFVAEVTPTVWVIDARGTVAYTGAIDDSLDAAGVKTFYLKQALDSVLAGIQPPNPVTTPSGCPIHLSRRKR